VTVLDGVPRLSFSFQQNGLPTPEVRRRRREAFRRGSILDDRHDLAPWLSKPVLAWSSPVVFVA
jgi:hypothetical protein